MGASQAEYLDRLIIRLDVDLALGQHLGKLPLQLLKLGVVGNNVNRSTECSEMREAVGEVHKARSTRRGDS